MIRHGDEATLISVQMVSKIEKVPPIIATYITQLCKIKSVLSGWYPDYLNVSTTLCYVLSWLITAQEHYDDGFRQNQRYQRQKVGICEIVSGYIIITYEFILEGG